MAAPIKENVSYDDWDKLDIRVGTIEKVEDVKGSKKLVALTVDFGDFTRTILTGLKEERENPQEIEGMQTLFLVNMAPRKMAGMTSEGMLLDIGYDDGIPSVIATLEKPVPNGTRLC
jgi:methionine--tRNA ligase beta chain